MKNKQPVADVLIPQCESRAGLAIVRALAKAGISCVVTSNNRDNIVYWSRHTRNFSAITHHPESPRDFFDQHLELAQRYQVSLIMPITDPGIAIFGGYRELLPASIKLALPSQDAINIVLDKNASFEMANRLAVPYPETFSVQSMDDIPTMISALGFPVVLKNTDPDNPGAISKFPFRYLVAHDEKALNALLRRHCRDGKFPLFQRYVTGKAHNVCCFASRGETLAMHEYVSLRRGAHVGIYREITELEPRLEHYCRKILADLNWDGVAQIGFLINEATNEIWFMEVNGRFWASVQGSKNAGWNFPLWHYELFQKGIRPSVPPLINGSRTRWHRGDLQALLEYLNGGPSPELYTNPGKWRSIANYLQGFSPAIGNDVFSLSDPAPAIIEHWHLLLTILKSLINRLKR